MVYENDRQVYEVVRGHLLTQNEKSADVYGTCFYRGPDRTMCAIGCLLTDEEAVIGDKDNHTGSSLPVKNIMNELESVRERFNNVNMPLLIDLQSVHDLYEVDEWREKLDDIGRYFTGDTYDYDRYDREHNLMMAREEN